VNTDILPLAITMMAGPQIMSAIVFVTSERALKNSLAFVSGVLVATAIGVAALRGLQSLVGGGVVARQAPAGRREAGAADGPPRDPRDALRLIVMLTVATNLEHNGDSLGAAVPFILLTTLIAALPLLGYLIFHRRAVRAMPSLRDWMNANSWLVNIIVCAIFIVLIV